MRHQDASTHLPSAPRSPRLRALGRCLAALVVYVGVMALLILPSRAFSGGADDPVLIVGLLAWWVGFPLVPGLWVRSFWWVPMAWLGPLLLYPIEPDLAGDQAGAAFMSLALFTAIVGVVIGRLRFSPDRPQT